MTKDITKEWNDVGEAYKTGDPEQLLESLSKYFKADADRESHETVVAILNGLSEDMHNAAFSYYASTK